jgi:hypothetical protein
MKVKTTIRYERFRPSENGGRIFDFWISESEQPDRAISVEIPIAFFEGQDRLHLQEGVGISYSRIKQFLEVGESWDTPLVLCLNAADVALHREVAPSVARRRASPTNAIR